MARRAEAALQGARRARVYVVECASYEAEAIAGHVRTATQALDISLPHEGHAFVLADCPWSHPRFAPFACSEPEVIEGIVRSVAGSSVTIGARSLPGIPTRYSLARAGYSRLAQRLDAELVAFDGLRVRPAGSPGADVPGGTMLPARWLDASFRIAAPRLTGSTYVPAAGAVRQLYSLLPAETQLAEQHRLPAIAARAAIAAQPDLVVLDAIRPTHRGGELSGEPVDLGLLFLGTDPFAVDLVAAVAYGVAPEAMAAAGGAIDDHIASLAQVELVGGIGFDELRARASVIERLDPDPANYPVPANIRVLRGPKASPSGPAATLTETFASLERAGINLAGARESTFVVGDVEGIPPGRSDQAAIVFVGDTARGSYTGYSRVVRLRGRNPSFIRILTDVALATNLANLRAELGAGFAMAGVTARILGALKRLRGWRDAAGRPPGRHQPAVAAGVEEERA